MEIFGDQSFGNCPQKFHLCAFKLIFFLPKMQIPNWIRQVSGWLFGLAAMSAGFLNIGWGNDPEFGIFVALSSLAFFPPSVSLWARLTRWPLPTWLQWLLGFFLTWAVLGVGELFAKIALMKHDF
jgi:hypothetical protein